VNLTTLFFVSKQIFLALASWPTDVITALSALPAHDTVALPDAGPVTLLANALPADGATELAPDGINALLADGTDALPADDIWALIICVTNALSAYGTD